MLKFIFVIIFPKAKKRLFVPSRSIKKNKKTISETHFSLQACLVTIKTTKMKIITVAQVCLVEQQKKCAESSFLSIFKIHFG